MDEILIDRREIVIEPSEGLHKTRIISLKYRPDFKANEWQVGYFDRWHAGGGFGYNSSGGNETEARDRFDELIALAEQEASEAKTEVEQPDADKE